MFSIVTFKRLCEHVSALLSIICRASRIAIHRINKGRSFTLRIFTISHIQSRNQGRFHRVIRERFTTIINICRWIASFLRFIPYIVLRFCSRIRTLSLFVGLQSRFSYGNGISVFQRFQRNGPRLNGRLPFQLGLRLQALSLLLRIRINGTQCVSSDILCPITR